MKIFLIILGCIVCVVTVLFYAWFSAMGCMSTTAAACSRNDFLTEEAIYMFYIPLFIGISLLVSGIRMRSRNG
jgi:hypothetical protein